MMPNRIATALALAHLVACGGTPPAEPPPRPTGATHAEHHEEAIRLDAETRARHGITLATAGPGAIDLGIELLGVVQPNGDRLAHITPRFPGIVREVRKAVCDAVRTGDVLAIVESSESLAPYELKTLTDGTIIEKHLTRGEAVDRDRQCFVIADLQTVWVDLSIYQKDLERVRVGQTVRVRASQMGPQAEGTLSYITPGVDQTTRTATARVVLPNPDGRWRPGMFVTARALEPVDVPLAVPTSALQTVGGRPTVFVVKDDRVEPYPVTLGRQGEQTAEVLAGLQGSETLVATNSFLFKAELGKGEAEHEE